MSFQTTFVERIVYILKNKGSVLMSVLLNIEHLSCLAYLGTGPLECVIHRSSKRNDLSMTVRRMQSEQVLSVTKVHISAYWLQTCWERVIRTYLVQIS